MYLGMHIHAYINVCVCVCVTAFKEKENKILRQSKSVHGKGWKEERERGGMMLLYFNFQNKKHFTKFRCHHSPMTTAHLTS